MKEFRKVEKLNNGKWNEVNFRKLQIGDKFRMFEEDGTPVSEGEVFEAISLPYIYGLKDMHGIQVKGCDDEKSCS